MTDKPSADPAPPKLRHAANTAALVTAILSTHASFLPEHVIKAAAVAAAAATFTDKRNHA